MTTLVKRSTGNAPAPTFGSLVDRIFQNNLNNLFDDSTWGFSGLNRNVNVPINVRETDAGFDLELVAPGMKKEDFNIQVNGDMLTVSFEQKEERSNEDKSEGWLRKEYRLQSFTRSFNLDDSVDTNKISAQYRDGILHLNMPKKEGARRVTKTIEIK